MLEETLKKMRKEFGKIPARENPTAPEMVDVVTCVSESLLCLDPEMFSFEIIEMGHNHIFHIYKNNQLFGRYSIGPGSPGGPSWNKRDTDPRENLKLAQEWEFIWLMVWTDVARRFGRWPWNKVQLTNHREKQKGGRPYKPANKYAYEQVNLNGRDPKDVFPEWIQIRGDEIDLLADPLDSFKKAIKKKRGNRD